MMQYFVYDKHYDWNCHKEYHPARYTLGEEIVVHRESADSNQHCPYGGNDNCFLKSDGVEKLKRSVRKHQQYEAEHKAVAVIEPVGILETVPRHVQRRDYHREKEKEQYCGGSYFLPARHSCGNKVHRDKHERQHTAVSERIAFGSYCII